MNAGIGGPEQQQQDEDRLIFDDPNLNDRFIWNQCHICWECGENVYAFGGWKVFDPLYGATYCRDCYDEIRTSGRADRFIFDDT